MYSDGPLALTTGATLLVDSMYSCNCALYQIAILYQLVQALVLVGKRKVKRTCQLSIYMYIKAAKLIQDIAWHSSSTSDNSLYPDFFELPRFGQTSCSFNVKTMINHLKQHQEKSPTLGVPVSSHRKLSRRLCLLVWSE